MSEIPAGAMRFNSDSQKLEYWNGSAWFQVHTTTPDLASAGDPTPGPRGLIGGGGFNVPTTTYRDSIEYVNISSTGDAKEFGELQVARQIDASFSSPTRGFFAGGASGSGPDYEASTNGRIIEFVITSSLGDTTDFGDLINGTFGKHGSSNSIRGIIGGGYPSVKHVEYITMATLGNANDFGDTITSHYYGAAASNSTRSIIGGGEGPTDTIEYVATAQKGNGVDFGNLTQSRANLKGISNGNGGL